MVASNADASFDNISSITCEKILQSTRLNWVQEMAWMVAGPLRRRMAWNYGKEGSWKSYAASYISLSLSTS
jgi:hypothetical protein